jgi:protein phosphatase
MLFNVDEVSGQVPEPRFGHTAVCLENGGSPKVILFGGAVGDNGKYSITNDTYVLDAGTNHWQKLLSSDESEPSPRAAHAAVAFGGRTMLLYGGATGGGGLSTSDIFCLKLSEDGNCIWSRLEVALGPSPGRRYGHVMLYQKPFLVIFGGNTGSECVNDVWVMNLDKPVKTWLAVAVTRPEASPCARVYHSADVCVQGRHYKPTF